MAEQLLATNAASRGIDLRGLRNPHALAQRYLAHRRLLSAPDRDDVLSDAMYGIACGVATWREDGGRSLLSWCWLHMDREVGHGRTRRARLMAHEEPTGQVEDPEWIRVRTFEPGFKQIDDRVTLQRWADMAHLTDVQADVLAWLAVHYGTVVRHTHLRGETGLLHDGGMRSVMKAGLAKLRRVAVTGCPWVRTSRPPVFTLVDVRQAVAG